MRIYLDHNASTTPGPEVGAAMATAMALCNPSSLHHEGRAARDAIERARRQVAALVGCDPREVVFTSGGTEANHMAIGGAARMAWAAGGPARVIAGKLEHPSVYGALAALEKQGFTVDLLPVDGGGRIDAGDLRRSLLAGGAALVTMQLVNHEIGTVNAIAELAPLCRAAGALLHSDAVQAAGRVPVFVPALGVDLLSLSAHKLHGPKGVGALVVKGGVEIAALLTGGKQERGQRAGTENVPGIVGFGLACALATDGLATRAERIAGLRDRLEQQLLAIRGARRNGDGPRAPGTCNIAFSGVEAELLMMNLDLHGVACSTGSACSSGSPEPSPVLLALGQREEAARQGLRLSLGQGTTAQEIDQVAVFVGEIVAHLRSL